MSANDDQPTSPSRPDELADRAALQRVVDTERRMRVLTFTEALLKEHAHTLERLREL